MVYYFQNKSKICIVIKTEMRIRDVVMNDACKYEWCSSPPITFSLELLESSIHSPADKQIRRRLGYDPKSVGSSISFTFKAKPACLRNRRVYSSWSWKFLFLNAKGTMYNRCLTDGCISELMEQAIKNRLWKEMSKWQLKCSQLFSTG